LKSAPKPKATEASGLDEHATRVEFSNNRTGPQGVTDTSNAGDVGLSPVTPIPTAGDVDSSSVTLASTIGNTVAVGEPGLSSGNSDGTEKMAEMPVAVESFINNTARNTRPRRSHRVPVRYRYLRRGSITNTENRIGELSIVSGKETNINVAMGQSEGRRINRSWISNEARLQRRQRERGPWTCPQCAQPAMDNISTFRRHMVHQHNLYCSWSGHVPAFTDDAEADRVHGVIGRAGRRRTVAGRRGIGRAGVSSSAAMHEEARPTAAVLHLRMSTLDEPSRDPGACSPALSTVNLSSVCRIVGERPVVRRRFWGPVPWLGAAVEN
jgi:hypothetical protein